MGPHVLSSPPLRLLVVLALVLGACGPGGAPAPGVSPGGSCTGTSALYIVSHQDDDLLFMNPDLTRDLRAGKRVRTVYLTAGDAGQDARYWREREAGIRAAYARMADAEDAWRTGVEFIGDKRLRVQTLRANPWVSVVFLRLPDGHLSGRGYRSTGGVSLEKLWTGAVPRMASLDGENQYSREELLDVLEKLMRGAEADCVSTLDSSELYTGDHSDHRHSAKFAFEAHRAYSRPHRFSQYRGYNIGGEPVNLSSESRDLKWDVFSTYAKHDSHLCRSKGTDCLPRSNYARWVWRQYAAVALQDLSGSFTGLAGRCLGVRTGDSAPGSPVVLGDCGTAPRREWTLLANGQLRGPSGHCLEVREGEPSNGAPVQLGECAQVPRQKWTLLDNGQLRGPSGRCLEARADDLPDGALVRLGDCANVPQQKWSPRFGAVTPWMPGAVTPAGGGGRGSWVASSFRLADVNGDGLGDACVRTQEGLSCALNTGTGAFSEFRLFLSGTARAANLQFADVNHDGRADACWRSAEGVRCATADANGTAFVGASTWTSESIEGSFQLTDVDGDGFADLCGRSEEGVRCALNDRAGHFAPSTVWLGVEGAEVLAGPWPALGSALLFGDVNHDGRADVCGRSDVGVHCALANREGTGFEDLHRWSFRSEFSDAEGWGSTESCHGSLRLADVNGDGFADLCGRWTGGLVCALSNGARFQQLQSFQPEGYTDARGWRSEGRGATLQFLDLDGDGHADVCGWGASGVFCALAPGGADAVSVVGSPAP